MWRAVSRPQERWPKPFVQSGCVVLALRRETTSVALRNQMRNVTTLGAAAYVAYGLGVNVPLIAAIPISAASAGLIMYSFILFWMLDNAVRAGRGGEIRLNWPVPGVVGTLVWFSQTGGRSPCPGV